MLGAAEVHQCACGMKKGACGCPECERLEAQNEADQERLREHAILRSSCDNGTGVPGVSTLPAFAAPFTSLLPARPFAVADAIRETPLITSRNRGPPPTPPPKPVQT
jgi:hypothetical protein